MDFAGGGGGGGGLPAATTVSVPSAERGVESDYICVEYDVCTLRETKVNERDRDTERRTEAQRETGRVRSI